MQASLFSRVLSYTEWIIGLFEIDNARNNTTLIWRDFALDGAWKNNGCLYQFDNTFVKWIGACSDWSIDYS